MINRLLKLPILFWQRIIAPCLPGCCRFEPSCSQYALDALDRYGWPRALGLIAWRIARCQPFCRGGYDPVPGAEGHACAHQAPTKTPAEANKA